jgi:hypothetical protein
MQSPRVTITHGGVSILVCFDGTGTYAHLTVTQQQDDAERHGTPV